MINNSLMLVGGSMAFMSRTQRILELGDYDVRCSVGVSEAREMLRGFTPDAIILEHELPDGIGLEYLRELRAACEIPVIFLSNDGDDELQALQAGANDYLKKPYDIEILKMRLRAMLNTNAASSHVNGDAETEPDAADKQIDAAPPAARKNRMGAKALVFTAIALSMIFTTVVPRFVDRPRNIDTASLLDDRTPLAYPTVDSPYKPDYHLPGYTHITAAADGVIRQTFYNPENNPFDISYELVVVETGETLYASVLIKPGAHVNNAKLGEPLPAGKYPAVLIIRAYGIAGIDGTALAEMGLELTVE